jgi:uncharacterized membrane protein YfcA
MPSLVILVFAPLIVVLAYIIFGIAGFGSTLISIPLLAHLYPLKFVLPVVVVLDCVGAFSMGIKLRADVNKRELLPVMFLGLYFGHRLHLNLPRDTVVRVIGGLLIASGFSLLLRALSLTA